MTDNDKDTAADHIEQLEALNKELTLQLLATSGQAADALDKLAKAVETLRFYTEYEDLGRKAYATLEELGEDIG